MSWSTSELRVRLALSNRFKPSSKIFFLTVPRRYFFWGCFMLFLSCVCYAFVSVCLYVPCGHLLVKGWPLGSRLLCLTRSLLLSHWCPGSVVVLDYIDSWSLHPYFLFSKPPVNKTHFFNIAHLLLNCLKWYRFNGAPISPLVRPTGVQLKRKAKLPTVIGLTTKLQSVAIHWCYSQSFYNGKGPRTVSYSICPNFDRLWLG